MQQLCLFYCIFTSFKIIHLVYFIKFLINLIMFKFSITNNINAVMMKNFFFSLSFNSTKNLMYEIDWWMNSNLGKSYWSNGIHWENAKCTTNCLVAKYLLSLRTTNKTGDQVGNNTGYQEGKRDWLTWAGRIIILSILTYFILLWKFCLNLSWNLSDKKF